MPAETSYGITETTQVVTFVASLARDIVKAREDGKISFVEAGKIALGNFKEGRDAFEGIDRVLLELADAEPSEMDACYHAWLVEMEWNEEPRTEFRTIFNESILTVRQLLRLFRLIQHTVKPPKPVVIPDNLEGVDPP
jgi:hypothetical protein